MTEGNSEVMAMSALMANRPVRQLAGPWAHTDVSFAAQRLDGVSIDLGLFSHCTFTNVSFKGCAIDDSRFINCTFISCYFRKATGAGTDWRRRDN